MAWGMDFAALTGLSAATLDQLPYLPRLAARRAAAYGFTPAFGYGGFWVAVPEITAWGRMPQAIQFDLQRSGFVRTLIQGVPWWGWQLVPSDVGQEDRINEIASTMSQRKAAVAIYARRLGAIVNFYGAGVAAVFDGPVSTGFAMIGGPLPPTLRTLLRDAGYVSITREGDPPGTRVWVSSRGFYPYS